MKAELQHKEPQKAEPIQSKREKAKLSFVDNRPESISNGKLINAIQAKSSLKSVIQRVNEGEDNDKGNIEVRDITGDDLNLALRQHTYRSRGNLRYSTDTVINQDLRINGENYRDKKLKHYMVVKNGTTYQFPVKYLRSPMENRHNTFIPNTGREDTRGNQPEGFGGNQDWVPALMGDRHNADVSLYDSRNYTLAHEYKEEARLDNSRVTVHDGDAARSHFRASDNIQGQQQNDVELSVVRSKLFGTGWGAGTLSIASTAQALQHRFSHNGQGNPPAVANQGMAEMAGTIVINCADLVRGALVGDELENAIGALITQERNRLLDNNRLPSPFAREGGILAHLVGMVAEDIIAQRAGA